MRTEHSWSLFGWIYSFSCEEFTHWKRPWCWEGLGAGGEGDDRGWDGWMASPTRGAWVWVNSGSWWWTGRPGVLRFMGSQRVRHDWATELHWTELIHFLGGGRQKTLEVCEPARDQKQTLEALKVKRVLWCSGPCPPAFAFKVLPLKTTEGQIVPQTCLSINITQRDC